VPKEQPVHMQEMQRTADLTSKIAHDFNNLLGVIIGNLDLLAPRLADDAEARELLDAALGAAVRGAELTTQLLTSASRQAPEPQTQTQPSPPLEPTAAARTVLVVEDNDAIRKVVVRLLAEFGYRTVEADGAAPAAAILASEEIDVLLTDIVMPGAVDGIELARRAKIDRPSLKVLLTSGFSEAKLASRGAALADMRLLSKPYRREDLARTLTEMLDT
jgi:CheY-like chemotaxis protein